MVLSINLLQTFRTVLFYIFKNEIFLTKKFAFFVNLLFLWLLLEAKGLWITNSNTFSTKQ